MKKKIINYQEFELLKIQGKKGAIIKGYFIIVKFNCKNCGKETQVNYRNLLSRKIYQEPICVNCCGKLTPKVSYVDAEFRKNPEYNKKLSKGVKKHREEHPEVLKTIKNKLIEIWNTQEKKEIQREASILNWKNPEYREKVISKSHRNILIKFNEIQCQSIAEYSFIKYMFDKCDKIERCNFSIPYIFENKERNYIPDFKITIGEKIIIYEIKGIYKKRLEEKDNLKFKQGFLNKDFIEAKFNSLKFYCKEKGWECRMLLLDDQQFAKIYRESLKEFKIKEYENNKKRENTL